MPARKDSFLQVFESAKKYFFKKIKKTANEAIDHCGDLVSIPVITRCRRDIAKSRVAN
jgi:hypothetical protein